VLRKQRDEILRILEIKYLYRLAQQLAVADFQCIEFAFLKHYTRKRRATQRKKTAGQCFSGKTKPTWQNSAIFKPLQK